MEKPFISTKKTIAIVIEKEQLRYLKKNGISRSQFFRQAIKAHQDRKWDYNFLPDED